MGKLYSTNGKPFDTSNYSPLTNGKRANFYQNPRENKVLKVYKNPFTCSPISETVFRDLKWIDSKTLPKLDEILLSTGGRNLLTRISGYTEERISNDHTDVLTMDSGRFAVNIAGKLTVLSDELAAKRITMSDPKINNIIVNYNGIFIIDPDLFIKDSDRTEGECTRINKELALKYIKLIILESAEKKHNLGDKKNEVDRLFNFNIYPSTDLASEVYQRLNDQTLLKILRR